MKAYLQDINDIKAMLHRAKAPEDVDAAETLITEILFNAIIAQTCNRAKAMSYCNQLMTASLVRRCEIIAYQSN